MSKLKRERPQHYRRHGRASLWHDSRSETKQKRSFGRALKRLLAAPFVLFAALIILLEDWLWDDLARLGAAIGRLPVFRQIESLIVALPPYAALLFFAVPSLLLVPVKLAALYLISRGQTTLGLVTVIGAKVAGTALIARIYTLTRPKLLRILWFARLHVRFLAFKSRVYEAIRSTTLYRAAHDLQQRFRQLVSRWRRRRQSLGRRRWSAALQVARRRKPTLW
jgi:hypothetical protein